MAWIRRRREAVTQWWSDSERGDVPGWVMVTLMTAGLVAVIWALAGDALADLFNQAIARVTGM